ncbi:putative LRR receptor-like serine/threonine-protein kinase At1g53440 [Apium graveolens]|uniref:putative LRR receptor-like serine/threonine-protein kinase At1g53440 n=1 Tax=Apium graveolens TaxID=4045 RepID=UPI003D7A74A1
MQSLHVLILRNCLINGALPEYFGVLGQLKTLDVSYNNFSRTAEYNCQPSNVVAWCLKKDLPCSRKPQYYSLLSTVEGLQRSGSHGLDIAALLQSPQASK